MNEIIKISKLNEKITKKLRLITINSEKFITFDNYKHHLKKTDMNFNHFDNKIIAFAFKKKISNFKNYTRAISLFKTFKRIVMPSRIKPRNKLKSQVFGNIFAKKNKKIEKNKNCYNCDKSEHFA